MVLKVPAPRRLQRRVPLVYGPPTGRLMERVGHMWAGWIGEGFSPFFLNLGVTYYKAHEAANPSSVLESTFPINQTLSASLTSMTNPSIHLESGWEVVEKIGRIMNINSDVAHIYFHSQHF